MARLRQLIPELCLSNLARFSRSGDLMISTDGQRV